MSRRAAREKAMQTLFQIDVGGTQPDQALKLMIEDSELASESKRFARLLVLGALENLETIDQLIRRHSREWDVLRLANVDRNILRLAIFEMLFQNDIPHNVSINEAVELAKIFGSEDSGSFVNGVLDSVRKVVHRDAIDN